MSTANSQPGRPKLLVMEFWGIGDLTFATSLLHALQGNWDITVLGKAHAQPLLEPTFPNVHFIPFDPPWTVFRGKYRLWRWDWPPLLGLIARLRREHFDAVVSVRDDPRDHLLMWLTEAGRRLGFPARGSQIFLTDPLIRPQPKQHKVEDWQEISSALGNAQPSEPSLTPSAYRSAKVDQLLASVTQPVVCLHTGARIKIRRWPAQNFAKVIRHLRQKYRFHLLLVPEIDGYGMELAPLADTVAPPLSLGELVDVLSRCELLLCNDSGPGHIAASCGRPVVPICGPTDFDRFRPWGDTHHLVIRDICPYRPCFDYCRFSEPYCLTRLPPEPAAAEIDEHLRALIARGVVSIRPLEASPPAMGQSPG